MVLEFVEKAIQTKKVFEEQADECHYVWTP